MFDKLKQLKQLKDLQNILSKERVEVERDGIKIAINGKLEIEMIQINAPLEKEKLEKSIRDCFNEAIKKINMQIAQKMSHMQGIGL